MKKRDNANNRLESASPMPKPRRVGLAVDFHLLFKRHSEVFAGIQRYADEAGWVTIVDDMIVGALADAKPGHAAYDGVIARIGAELVQAAEGWTRAGVPLVNVLASSPIRDRLPSVFPDFEEVGRLRAEHLMSRGLRHFACSVIRGSIATECDAAAFASAVTAAGYSVTRLELSETWADTLPLYRQNTATIRKWIEGWDLPIGVASSTDVFARIMAQICQERGLRVPEDVAIVGGQNEERLCEMPRPALTSVEIGYARIGYEAARLLDELMDETEKAPRHKGNSTKRSARSAAARTSPKHVILPPVGIVVRESTDFIVTSEKVVAQAQAYITAHCHTHLEVTDVAANVGVSPKTLQTRFAETLRRTVAQEIRRVRIEKAKRELAGGTRSIEEIAQRAGFTSATRLGEVFKREVGVTPREYRRERKTQGNA
jgi:LacI family transcriptional regulator